MPANAKQIKKFAPGATVSTQKMVRINRLIGTAGGEPEFSCRVPGAGVAKMRRPAGRSRQGAAGGAELEQMRDVAATLPFRAIRRRASSVFVVISAPYRYRHTGVRPARRANRPVSHETERESPSARGPARNGSRRDFGVEAAIVVFGPQVPGAGGPRFDDGRGDLPPSGAELEARAIGGPPLSARCHSSPSAELFASFVRNCRTFRYRTTGAEPAGHRRALQTPRSPLHKIDFIDDSAPSQSPRRRART